jgi:hypothetical protein
MDCLRKSWTSLRCWNRNKLDQLAVIIILGCACVVWLKYIVLFSISKYIVQLL